MPYATPGVGECRICFEVVPSVKLLDCDHQLCLACTSQLVQAADSATISCPECRQGTDCSRGLNHLRTRYFGKIRCDICLEKKEADDLWWCRDCYQGLCSKCSIKEHANKRHNISEWNRMEAVQFSVDYVRKVQWQRQDSLVAQQNRQTVRHFMEELEHCLLARLDLEPSSVAPNSDVQQLQNSILSRYGTRFSSSDEPSTELGTISEVDEDGQRKTVAKVLQLAGANVADAIIPSVKHQLFQLQFAVKPETIAENLKAKINLVPLESSSAGQSKRSAVSLQDQSKTAQDCSSEGEHLTTGNTTAEVVELSRPDGSKEAPVLQVDYNFEANKILVRTNAEIQLYSVTDGSCFSLPIPGKQNARSSCFGTDAQLLVCLQSVEKRYRWTMQSYNVSSTPISCLWTADMDVDPEDRVQDVVIRATGADSVKGRPLIYELRQCAEHVTEIWKAVCKAVDKKGVAKLKESLLYQRPNCRYSNVCVARPLTTTEEKERRQFLFVWDDVSSCLYRLILKDGRCEQATTVLHSASPIPFVLSAGGQRLFFYDRHNNRLCASNGAVNNRRNVTFSPFSHYPFGQAVSRLKLDADATTLACVAVAADNVLRYTFKTA